MIDGGFANGGCFFFFLLFAFCNSSEEDIQLGSCRQHGGREGREGKSGRDRRKELEEWEWVR